MSDHLADRGPAQRLLDTSSDALLALTLDGRVLSWNRGAESMFGYTLQEAVGRRLLDLTVPDEHRQEAVADLRRVLQSGAVAGERRRRRKDGALIPVHLVMHRHDGDGDAPFVASIETAASS